MKVVLATAPDAESPWNQGSFPPLGLLYLASGLKDIPEASVEIADTYAEGLTVDQSVERILSFCPDILGVTFTSNNVMETCQLVMAVKRARPSVKTVCGGIHATMFDDLLLKEVSELDYVLRGEGDRSFPELCERLLEGKDVESLPGLSFRQHNEIVRGEPQLIEDLDDIPFPDRSLLSSELYATQWYGYKFPKLPGWITTIFSSRGCPFGCTFCSMVKFFGRKFRARSAQNIFQELKLIRQQGFKLVIFFDDNFTVDSGRVQELCEMLIQAKLGLRFGFAGSLHLLPETTLMLMQKAGFDLAFIGVESGSDKVLSFYKKPAKRKALAAAVLRAKKAHMFVIASFIAGAPVEDETDFQQTLDFIMEVKPTFCDVNPLMVHPGSCLWDEIRGNGRPSTLEGSVSRTIWRFTQQVDKKVVEKRILELKRVFLETYLLRGGGSRRIPEMISLLTHNKSTRMMLWQIIQNIPMFLELSDIKLR